MAKSQASVRNIASISQMLVLVSLAVLLLNVIPAVSRSQGGCPDIIAKLLPANGAKKNGSYNVAGSMGMGNGVAELAFEHPCISTTKYPARITFSVWYYGGEMAMLLQMQGDAADQQTIQNAVEGLGSGSAGSKNPVRREKLAGGEIVYIDYKSDCPPEGAGEGPDTRPQIPNVQLKGVARTANVRMEITLEGRISLDLAKAAVAEVFGNLKKAEFDKAK